MFAAGAYSTITPSRRPAALPIQAVGMLTTSIIFTVLVVAWGHSGAFGQHHRGDR
jgi:hypothetical protein